MTDEILDIDEQEEETPVVTEEPTPPTIAEKVKLALRISHNLLDGEITDVIASARLELKRAGVDSEYAEGDTEDVETAIRTYALSYYASDVKDADRYTESFKYQCDCMRKSSYV
jgi:uncharacterized phage protein (predicted DNA packaging)